MKASLTSFTNDELFRLLAYMREHDPQLHAMALLSLYHGMRRGEILELAPENISKDGRITFTRLKNSLPCSAQKLTKHHVPEYDEVAAVQRYLAYPQIREDGRVTLFDVGVGEAAERHINRLMVRYCEAVGIPRHKAHWSSWKHSCGKHLLPILGISELQLHLGHVEVKNTLAYARASADEVETKLAARVAESRALAEAGGD